MKETNLDKTNKSNNKTITLDELKQFLWGAAVLLRGQIDATGYKEYIFPLLFFKRISDVYDEQYASYVAEGGEEFANEMVKDLSIQIPEDAHWENVRAVTENVGQRLVESFIAIEQANPGIEMDGRIVGGLTNIFGPKDGWTNKAKMPDHIITSLIEHFSKHELGLKNCPADEMGQAYEYLVGKFADDAGNTAQEFYTNRTVVTLMAEILQPRPNESIYDPTCGSGGMLIKCLNFLRDKGEEWQGVKVFGQEINALTSSIARMNLYLNGVEDFSIVREDTLAHPAFVDGSQLRKFDIVLANPPYSIKQWDREAFSHDKWGRNLFGTPPQGRADYAFIQHIIASMNEDTGRCAILLPHGILNRNEEENIRKNLVLTDKIETIIGLGRNLFYNSGLESCILICNNKKSEVQKNSILFIEAEKNVHRQGKNVYLSNEDIALILHEYYNITETPGISRRVSLNEILSNNGNLNIKLYVKSISRIETPNEIYFSNVDLQTNFLKLEKLLGIKSIGEESFKLWLNLPSNCQNLRKVKLSDVAEEYSERCDNPSESDFKDFIGSNCIGKYDFEVLNSTPTKQITSAQKLFKRGDYLLVRRSLYGSDFRERAPRATFDGVCSADILTIREKPGVIADGFLIYILYQKELWDYIVANSTGSLTRRIKWKQLADYEFYLPPFEEQRILSEKIWAAYRLKAAYQRLLNATKEMVKSQFIEMFGDPLTNSKNWQRKTLKEASVMLSDGPFGSNLKSEHYCEHGVRVVRLQNICQGFYDDTDKAYVSEEHANKLNKYICKPGDILIGTLGEPNLRACILPSYINKAINKADCVHYIPQDNLLNKIFVINYLNSEKTLQMATRDIHGTTRSRIAAGQLAKMPIYLPPLALQEQFAAIAEQADKSEFEIRKSIEAIDNVIKSLING